MFMERCLHIQKMGVDIGYVEIRMTTHCQIMIGYQDSINSALLTKERANEI